MGTYQKSLFDDEKAPEGLIKILRGKGPHFQARKKIHRDIKIKLER